MDKDKTQLSRGDSVSRRDILQVSTAAAVGGATGVIADATPAKAQQLVQLVATAPAANRPIRTGEPQPFYDYSPLPKRPKLKWPNGARVAVLIVPNVEHWDVHDDKGHMDVRNLPRNDYGLRVAIWRLMEMFGERRIQTTIALNASVCRFYPELIEAFRTRGDELMGHGVTNSEHLDTAAPAKAAAIVRQAVDMIQNATGQKVRGC